MSWNSRLVVLASVSMFLVFSDASVRGQNKTERSSGTAGPVSYSTEVVSTVPGSGVTANGTYCPGAPCCRTGRLHALHVPVVWWLLDDRYYARSPDYGWTRVVKRPIERKNVTYQQFWPSQWYGQRAAQYPVVASPSDTTQLGYYYQHVPQWQPNPAMLPQPPVPIRWHIRECQGQKCLHMSAPKEAPGESGNQPTPVEPLQTTPPPAPEKMPSAAKTATYWKLPAGE